MVRSERLHSCFTPEKACRCVRVLRQSVVSANFSPIARLSQQQCHIQITMHNTYFRLALPRWFVEGIH